VLDTTVLDAGPTYSRQATSTSSAPNGHGPAQAPFSPRKRTDTVFPGNRDAQGHLLAPSAQREFRLLRRRAREGASRVNARPGMSHKGEEVIRRLSVSLALPPLVQDAALLVLGKGGEARLFRGRSAVAAAAASVYAACRRYSLPRTWNEIASAAGISRAEFGRCYMALRRGLNLDLPPVGLGTYVRRFSTELKLSSQTLGKALTILDGVGSHPDACGVSPNGLAGAALYLASVQCGEPRKQSDVARVAQVTDVTLRHAFRRLGRIISGEP
jgi:transcription initiation factor TFIIB